MTAKEKRIKVWNKFDKHCSYCGKDIELKDMQTDHAHPKALNRPIGRDTEGKFIYPDIDAFDNLMPSCRRCNHYKRALTIEQFRSFMGYLHVRIREKYINKVAEDYGIITVKPFDGKFYFEKLTT